MVVHQARHFGSVQTDDIRFGMVFHLAIDFDGHLYHHIQPRGRYSDRWHPTAAVLSFRRVPVELFLAVPDESVGDILIKCRPFRQGVFPKADNTDFAGGVASLQVLDSDGVVCDRLHRLCDSWHACKSELVSVAVPCVGVDARVHGDGLGVDSHFDDDEIP